jgi:hypothetical protein
MGRSKLVNELPKTRVCRTCRKKFELSLSSYHKDKSDKHGFAKDCKSCANAKTRERQRSTTPSDSLPKMGKLKLESNKDRHDFAREQAAKNMYLD